jgi:hypothetical protein
MVNRRSKPSKQVDSLPKGKDDRPSVDWMDFKQADGGPTRKVVHLGVHEEPSQRDAPRQGDMPSEIEGNGKTAGRRDEDA